MEDRAARANAPEVDDLVGKLLDGRFRILERLGAGGMGTVYKAVQSPLDRLVALKVLNPNYDSNRDPGFQHRFFLEASVTSKLKHPNTITVIDYGKTPDGIYYIAMEFVEGITLAQVLTTEGALPWKRGLYISQQIGRSLREAHRIGVIHRDLKPANVMICTEETENDLVKVLDFGLVKSFLPEGPLSPPEAKVNLTQAGVFLGSPQYMAPEQARNVADPRSDIYSLGVMMYQMLMGRPPFFAEQSIDVIVMHMRELPPPFLYLRPDLEIPGEVEALVMKCLAKDPEQRYQSMDELLEGIRNAAAADTSGPFSVGRNSSQGMLPDSGAYRTLAVSSGPQRAPSGPRTGPRQTLDPIDVCLSDTQPTQPGLPAVSTGRKLRPLWMFLGSVAAGLAVVFLLLVRTPAPTAPVASPPPSSTPAPPSPVPTPAPAPGHVRFHVGSEPPGATVTLAGKELGKTPLEFNLPTGADGSASAKLTFTLEGYRRQTVTTAGTGDVKLNQRLQKKAPPTRKQWPRPKKPSP